MKNNNENIDDDDDDDCERSVLILAWITSKQTNTQTEKNFTILSFISVEERRYTEFSFTIWMKWMEKKHIEWKMDLKENFEYLCVESSGNPISTTFGI